MGGNAKDYSKELVATLVGIICVMICYDYVAGMESLANASFIFKTIITSVPVFGALGLLVHAANSMGGNKK